MCPCGVGELLNVRQPRRRHILLVRLFDVNLPGEERMATHIEPSSSSCAETLAYSNLQRHTHTHTNTHARPECTHSRKRHVSIAHVRLRLRFRGKLTNLLKECSHKHSPGTTTFSIAQQLSRTTSSCPSPTTYTPSSRIIVMDGGSRTAVSSSDVCVRRRSL